VAEEKSTLQSVVGFFGDLFQWVKEALIDDEVRGAIIADLGLDPEQHKSVPPPNFDGYLDGIERYRKTANPDKEALLAAIEDIKSTYEALRGYVEVLNDDSQINTELTYHFYRILTTNFVRTRMPLFYWFGSLFGFLQEEFTTETGPVGSSIGSFLKSPIDHLKGVYAEALPLDTEAQATLLSEATLAPLAIALGFWNKTLYKLLNLFHLGFKLPEAQVLYGWEAPDGSPTPVGDRLDARALSFALSGFTALGPKATTPPDPCGVFDPLEPVTTLDGSLSFNLQWVPRSDGGPGLFIAPGGTGQVALPLDAGWRVSMKLSTADAVDFLIRDWDDVDVAGPADASLEIALERPFDGIGPYVFEVSDGVRLETEALSLVIGISTSGPIVRFLAHNSSLVVAAENDAVLERSVQSDRLRIGFEFGLGFAEGRFYVEGGSGLQAVLPVGKSLGPVLFQSVSIGLTPSTDADAPDLRFETSTSLTVRLGPVTLTIDRIGLSAAMDFWDTPDMGFKAPSGIGVDIDAGTLSGGGFLFHDPERGQYAGILELTYSDLFTAKAIGLLTTKLDGKKIFSFLIILSVENFSFKLPFGFKLTGLGGIFGYDRTVSMDALKAGVRNHSLDRLMFPKDPVANAPMIVNTAATVFPPARDHTIVGPMAQITWLADSLVTIELGLILELPRPARLVILGKLRAFFPMRDAPVVKIQVDLVGDIDFGRKEALVLAVLVDSKIAGFPLTGAAALLMRWGDDPVFVLAFGGVNKRYESRLPDGFPKLERLSVPLTRGNNPKLRLECYVAMTSNSFQIGGKLELVASAGKFSIEGFLAIDALFQSGQPSIILDLDAKLQLKAWGVNLFAVRLTGTLSGTEPWHVKGKATFEIWIFDYSVSVDHTFGSPSTTPPALPSVDVRSQILTALRDTRNWRADPPALGQSTVALRTAANDPSLLVHPLGMLRVSQRVAPLDMDFAHIGNARPSGPARFSVTAVTVNGAPVDSRKISEKFARAQYFDMSDDQKLAAPSFEAMPAGVEVGTQRLTHGPEVAASAEYETLIYDAPTGTTSSTAERYTLSANQVVSFARTAAASVAPPGQMKYRGGVAKRVAVAGPRYVVASTDTLAPQVVAGTDAGATPSYSAAVAAMRAAVASNPAQRGQLQVLAWERA
jgi:hypothetical protein